MSYALRCTVLLIICLFASSCSNLHHNGPSGTQNLPRAQHVTRLAQVKSWRISGALGVRRPDKAWSAQYSWAQQQNNFHIHLFGPFGAGSVNINGNPNHATLTAGNKKEVQAGSAQTLLYQQTGMQVPIEYAMYWIRGLAVPGVPEQKSYDRYQHLASLTQHGWHITYDNYTTINGIDLPKKITLAYEQWVVKLIIKSWSLL